MFLAMRKRCRMTVSSHYVHQIIVLLREHFIFIQPEASLEGKKLDPSKVGDPAMRRRQSNIINEL